MIMIMIIMIMIMLKIYIVRLSTKLSINLVLCFMQALLSLVLLQKNVQICGRGLPPMLAAFNEMYRTCVNNKTSQTYQNCFLLM